MAENPLIREYERTTEEIYDIAENKYIGWMDDRPTISNRIAGYVRCVYAIH